MDKALESVSYAEKVLKAIEDIFENIYDYKGRSYAIGVCNKVRFVEKNISLFSAKNILKKLEEMKLIKRTPLRLKNAPLEFKLIVIAKQNYRSKNTKGYLQTPIYICHPDKLREYHDIVARQIKRQTE